MRVPDLLSRNRASSRVMGRAAAKYQILSKTTADARITRSLRAEALALNAVLGLWRKDVRSRLSKNTAVCPQTFEESFFFYSAPTYSYPTQSPTDLDLQQCLFRSERRRSPTALTWTSRCMQMNCPLGCLFYTGSVLSCLLCWGSRQKSVQQVFVYLPRSMLPTTATKKFIRAGLSKRRGPCTLPKRTWNVKIVALYGVALTRFDVHLSECITSLRLLDSFWSCGCAWIG